jgi:hypothetical protein
MPTPIAQLLSGGALLMLQACAAPVDEPPHTALPAHHQAHVQAYNVYVQSLKQAYLTCEQAAATAVVSGAAAMHCSTVYERLKTAAFAGRFDALNRWWQGERHKLR